MTVKYKTLITTAGAAKFAAATAGGTKITLTQMAVGDGGGTLPVPDVSQTKLISEKWRAALNKISVDARHDNYVVAELVIPPEVGGFWLREMGLYDADGTLVAVASMAESYKPELAEGSGRAQTLRMVIIVSAIESVDLTVDATMVMATQEYVEDKLAEHERSRRHPDATLSEKGFTQLSSATDSTSEVLAATPKAVKAAYDLANGKYTAQDATTARKGLVQLSSATDSTSEELAATPKAVKAAFDMGDVANKNADTRLGKNSNLADVTDKAQARDNLGLKSAALCEVQSSKDDVTPGRVVANGGAVAVRSAVASGVAGSFTADTNNLPENAVSFTYASAAHSPGFESSVLDFSGLGGRYNVQLAASYMQPGLVKLRTKNGDSNAWNNWTTFYTTENKPTPADIGALPSGGTAVAATKLESARKINSVAFDGTRDITLSPANIGALSAAGGELTGPVTFKNNSASYPVTLEGGSPTIVFSETDSGKKFFLVADGNAIRLQEDNTGNGKTAFAWDGNTLGTSGRFSAIGAMDITGPVPTIALNESDTGKTILLVMDGASIRLQEDNTGGREIFSWSTPQGALSTAGTFNASILYESGSRVYSPRNQPPQQDLSRYATTSWANIDLRNDIYNWANGRFMQGLRFGAVEQAIIYRALGYNDQLGYVITGVVNNSPSTPDDIVDIIQRRPLQVNINGAWMNVGQ